MKLFKRRPATANEAIVRVVQRLTKARDAMNGNVLDAMDFGQPKKLQWAYIGEQKGYERALQIIMQEFKKPEAVPVTATTRPAPIRLSVGDAVTCPEPDSYLRDYHHVVADETVGTVVRYSRLSDDDMGVLVDWGDGLAVRCERNELAAVDSDTPR